MTLPRDRFTGDAVPLSKAMPKLVADQNNAILVSNSFQEIYHTLEKEGDKGGKKLLKLSALHNVYIGQ